MSDLGFQVLIISLFLRNFAFAKLFLSHEEEINDRFASH